MLQGVTWLTVGHIVNLLSAICMSNMQIAIIGLRWGLGK